MKKIMIIHLGQGNGTEIVRFLNHELEVLRLGCGGDTPKARELIIENDGLVDAIGLEGMPALLELGAVQREHDDGRTLPASAQTTPVVDGRGIRAGLERWGIILADRAEPGIFSQKRILMVPGVNHNGLAQALSRHSPTVRYADPVIYFALPNFPGIGGKLTLQQAAGPTLEQLKSAPFRRIFAQPGIPGTPRYTESFEWADVIAGDIGAILRYAPENLKHKTDRS